VRAAAQLVKALRARGINLEPEGDQLRVRPASALSANELETLRQAKLEVLRFLQTTSAPFLNPVVELSNTGCEVRSERKNHLADAVPFLGMPLDRFAQEGVQLEVRVPWWARDAMVRPQRLRRGGALAGRQGPGKGMDCCRVAYPPTGPRAFCRGVGLAVGVSGDANLCRSRDGPSRNHSHPARV
jgi:hypothetical protein